MHTVLCGQLNEEKMNKNELVLINENTLSLKTWNNHRLKMKIKSCLLNNPRKEFYSADCQCCEDSAMTKESFVDWKSINF